MRKNELLHNTSNQKKNYKEILNHVPKNIRSSFKQIIAPSWDREEEKKEQIIEKFLVFVYNWLIEKIVLRNQEFIYSSDKTEIALLSDTFNLGDFFFPE